jgi:hypothetical protein
LPNTYYLKMTGVPVIVRIGRGLYVLLVFVWKANPILFLLAFATALGRDKRIWLLLWMLIVQMAYSVYVGGDAWEYWGGSNRYICIAMPGFFVLVSYAVYLVTSALTRVLRSRGLSITPAATAVASALVLVYAAVCLNSIYGRSALAEALLIRAPLHSGPGGENQQDVESALLLRRATSKDARIAIVRAGTIAYFADRYAIDLLGKNDTHVARVAAKGPNGPVGIRDFRPGHMKVDFAYSIGALKPDVIMQLRRRLGLAKPFLRDQYQDVDLNGSCLFARRASPRVFWEWLPPHGCEGN